jgi:hypothetical protein
MPTLRKKAVPSRVLGHAILATGSRVGVVWADNARLDRATPSSYDRETAMLRDCSERSAPL